MKKIISYIIVPVLILLTVIVGVLIGDRSYALITAIIALLSCVPFLLSYENEKVRTTELVMIAVMIALSALSRVIFAVTPHFKPITAIVVICGMYMGARSGFVCGSLSAVVSNIYFGQGPWTPFQMLAWGIVGFLAGVLLKKEQKNYFLLCLNGILSGVLFSLIMDLWSLLSFGGEFTFTKYLATIVTSAPITLTYVVSNVVFLIVLGKPMGKVIERVKNKYLY